MYFEETDFCLGPRRSGIECWYLPEGRIVHLVGQSSGVTGAARHKKRRPGYWFASRSRYFRRNLGSTAFHAANLLWLLAYPLGSCCWQCEERSAMSRLFSGGTFCASTTFPSRAAPIEHRRLPESNESVEPMTRERPISDRDLGLFDRNPEGVSFWHLLREDYRTHESEFFSQGFWAIAVHRFGNWRMGIRSRLLRLPFSFLYKLLSKCVEMVLRNQSDLHGQILGRRVRIWHQGGMVLGSVVDRKRRATSVRT